MPAITRDVDLYQSLIEPPAGYELMRTELLQESADGPTPEELDAYRELGLENIDFLDGLRIFRTIVCFNGEKIYTSSAVESVADLCKKAFWTDFWRQVAARDSKKGGP